MRGFRKAVAVVTMAALFVWAPSAIPIKFWVSSTRPTETQIASLSPCGPPATAGWLSVDTAFAQVPCGPPIHAITPWPVIIGALSAGSVILNALIVGRAQCRELTQQEAWSSIFLPFIGIIFNQQNSQCGPHHGGHH